MGHWLFCYMIINDSDSAVSVWCSSLVWEAWLNPPSFRHSLCCDIGCLVVRPIAISICIEFADQLFCLLQVDVEPCKWFLCMCMCHTALQSQIAVATHNYEYYMCATCAASPSFSDQGYIPWLYGYYFMSMCVGHPCMASCRLDVGGRDSAGTSWQGVGACTFVIHLVKSG